MSRRLVPTFITLAWAKMLLTLILSGCSYGPAVFEPPSIDPDRAAGNAMEMYDANGDNALSGEELDRVPGLKSAMETVDTNGDTKLDAGEIAARIRSWQESQVGVAGPRFIVVMNGQPLTGATVTFEPESFLGDEFLVGHGKTDDVGMVAPRIPKENRPSPDMPGGLQLGFYRVKVSKSVSGKETIPAKYNTETILGQQIALDDPALVNRTGRIELNSR